MSTQEKIDVRSCVQFLMELFEQWVSPYTQPKTPLMLLTQSVKSVSFVFYSCPGEVRLLKCTFSVSCSIFRRRRRCHKLLFHGIPAVQNVESL